MADQQRQDIFGLVLQAAPIRLPGGEIQFRDYFASTLGGYWELDYQLQDNTYNDVTSQTSLAEPHVAHWQFATQPHYPIYLNGHWFDTYAIAADVCEAWAAKEKLSFSFSTDRQTFTLREKIANLEKMAAAYRRKAKVKSATLVRNDQQVETRLVNQTEGLYGLIAQDEGW